MEKVFLLRVASAVGSAATFGLAGARLLPFGYWPSAFAMAFAYGFFFVGGTGYRILIAVALRDPSRHVSASWSGATAISALAAFGAALGLLIAGGDAAVLLAAYALAINVAYLPVKYACIEAGCCHAVRRARFLPRGADLRRFEIATTGLWILATFGLLLVDRTGFAALAGLTGHLATRLVSRWSRDRLPRPVWLPLRVGQELAPLTLLQTLSLWLAI